MEEIIKGLECVEVTYTSDKKKVTLTFYDDERGEIREVNYNKQSYDATAKKYIDDPEKVEKIDKMIDEELGLTFETLNNAVGMRKDVYCYDKFCSLHPVVQTTKFTEDMKGEIYQTEIKEIEEGDFAIRIKYEIDGETYESKMTHGKYMENMKKWLKDPQKKAKVYERFEEKFLVPVSEKDTLIGHPIMVEVKAAFGASLYGDIKKFPRKK